MKYLLAIDPGDKHNGIVKLTEAGDLIDAVTLTPQEAIRYLDDLVTNHHQDISRVVVERFQIYPSKAKFMAWKSLEIVEMIGVIKFICSKVGISWAFVAPPDAHRFWLTRQVPDDIREQLHTAHELSAYRIGEMVRTLKPLTARDVQKEKVGKGKAAKTN
ncbi:hypothetical protein LCGC14_1102180 [marine sediment metagenome]|uniref:YqgF/RNase H-like domain-containing protein n=1 Tax=marine sediment metagenome TaxID=412755 RepID=A0A0F9MDQ2_9ZZZZ